MRREREVHDQNLATGMPFIGVYVDVLEGYDAMML